MANEIVFKKGKETVIVDGKNWEVVKDSNREFDYPILIKVGRKYALNVPKGWERIYG